jgi:hypothetical protein
MMAGGVARGALIALAALFIGACHAEVDRPDAASSDASLGACEAPRVICSQTCSNPQTDPFNCGRCGNECPTGMFCNAGMCAHVCESGRMACGASCVDPATDHENCGGCNAPCAADRQCKGGECHCPDQTTECNGACVNPNEDPNNCGICGRMCTSQQICSQGSCVCAGGTKETNCTDGIDNDCDGLIDCMDPDCVGTTKPCMGRCGMGVESCQMDGTYSACMGGDGSPDVCGSGIDSDCDGMTLRAPSMYEPNDTCGEGWPIPGTNPSVTLTPRFDSVEDSYDFFKLVFDDTISYPQHIQITMDQIPMGHDYDLFLYASYDACQSMMPIASSTHDGNAPEMIDWAESFGTCDSGTYYIRVARISGYSCTESYRLVIDASN